MNKHEIAVKKKLAEAAEQFRWNCLRSIGIYVESGKATDFLRNAHNKPKTASIQGAGSTNVE